jgi:hypothetical protein
MGLKSSLYNSIQSFPWGEEIIRGSNTQPDNVLSWDYVDLNLPGTQGYQNTEPWGCKLRQDVTMAPYCFVYVDDIRNHGNTEEEGWQVARRVAAY